MGKILLDDGEVPMRFADLASTLVTAGNNQKVSRFLQANDALLSWRDERQRRGRPGASCRELRGVDVRMQEGSCFRKHFLHLLSTVKHLDLPTEVWENISLQFVKCQDPGSSVVLVRIEIASGQPCSDFSSRRRHKAHVVDDTGFRVLAAIGYSFQTHIFGCFDQNEPFDVEGPHQKTCLSISSWETIYQNSSRTNGVR